MATKRDFESFRCGVLTGAGGGLLMGLGVVMICIAVLPETNILVVRDSVVLFAISLFVAGILPLRKQKPQS